MTPFPFEVPFFKRDDCKQCYTIESTMPRYECMLLDDCLAVLSSVFCKPFREKEGFTEEKIKKKGPYFSDPFLLIIERYPEEILAGVPQGSEVSFASC